MKNIFLAIVLTLTACDYNRFDTLSDKHNDVLIVNSSIGQLKLGEVRSSTVIRGVVVTSDSTGNFYKEFLITDPTQGKTLRIRAGIYEIYTLYQHFAQVVVELQGTEVLVENNLLTVKLASNLALISNRVQNTGLSYNLSPIVTTIDKLSDLAPGSFIELREVYFKDATYRSFAGLATVVEFRTNRSVELYTSPYASFANDALPAGVLTIRGILLFVNDKPQIKLIDKSYRSILQLT